MQLSQKAYLIFTLSGIFFLLFLFLLLKSSNTCKFSLPNGYIVDLSSVANQDYILQKGFYTVRANICAKTSQQCVSSNNSPAVLQFKNGKCYSLSPSWNPRNRNLFDENVLSLEFKEGDKCFINSRENFHVEYIVKCSHTRIIELTNVEQSAGCYYKLYFNTQFACPEYVTGGISFKSSKTILCFIVIMFTLYLATFTYKNYKQAPEDGVIKALPHREFWREFFSDVRRGVNVSYETVKRLMKGKKEESYNDY